MSGCLFGVIANGLLQSGQWGCWYINLRFNCFACVFFVGVVDFLLLLGPRCVHIRKFIACLCFQVQIAHLIGVFIIRRRRKSSPRSYLQLPLCDNLKFPIMWTCVLWMHAFVLVIWSLLGLYFLCVLFLSMRFLRLLHAVFVCIFVFATWFYGWHSMVCCVGGACKNPVPGSIGWGF